MIGLFKFLCLSFAWLTLCAVFLALFFSWKAFSPKTPDFKADKYSDNVYQCVHVAQWTLIAAGVSGMVWCVLECLYFFWTMQ